MKITLISDTHGFLEPKAVKYLKQADEIWHAGDIGTIELYDELKSMGPLRAVYGNIDGGILRKVCPEDEKILCEGVKVYMTHIAGKPPRYNSRVLSEIRRLRPDIFICGHSHILKVMQDKTNNLLFMNPGALGNHGFHKMKTLLRFEIISGQIQNLEAVELGKRGALS